MSNTMAYHSVPKNKYRFILIVNQNGDYITGYDGMMLGRTSVGAAGIDLPAQANFLRCARIKMMLFQ